MSARFTFTGADVEEAAKALLAQQNEAMSWSDLDEDEAGQAHKANLESDVIAVLEAIGGTWT